MARWHSVVIGAAWFMPSAAAGLAASSGATVQVCGADEGERLFDRERFPGLICWRQSGGSICSGSGAVYGE